MRGSSRKFGVRTPHSMSHFHALMLCVWFSSTSPLSSNCFSSCLLSSCRSSWPSNFIFHDVVDKFPVHSRWWGPWHSCRVRPSHMKSWQSDNQMRFLECLQSTGKILHGNTYHSRRNQFERFRAFLELISRFEFEFRRRENCIFWSIRIFGVFKVPSHTPCGCPCACAVACLHPHNSSSNVVVSVTIHDNIEIYFSKNIMLEM